MSKEQNLAETALLRQQAIALAGNTSDLVQRASVYHHLYEHSSGNHSFPLLAAHGALWASGYFSQGMKLGNLIAFARSLVGHDRKLLLSDLNTFAEAFRDINRRVCIETYFIYWLTARPHLRDEAEEIVPTELLNQMDRCHFARRTNLALSEVERRRLFSAFFLWEQANIVGPSIDLAFAAFDWKLIKNMALKPRICFSYFNRQPLIFENFSDTNERIRMGMLAFDRACTIGWNNVEKSLNEYQIMPTAFLLNSSKYFDVIRESLTIGDAKCPKVA